MEQEKELLQSEIQSSVEQNVDLPPYKQLQILLVEDDDSTRHIVAALLRNCGYRVVTAANGLRGWAILEDPANSFDLILTNVAMPGLSGVGLLSRITNHPIHRKIPVVMMSSHDSTRIVFKCLIKGAVDFLVKPVRKNELKNLWQHSWRRCQSSSGSGDPIENENTIGGQGMRNELEVQDCSDDTQTSCTLNAEKPELSLKPELLEMDDIGTTEACSGQHVVDLIGSIANDRIPAQILEEVYSDRNGSNSLDATKNDDSDSGSRLELSLRTSTMEQKVGVRVLGRSGPSAFSRYKINMEKDAEKHVQHYHGQTTPLQQVQEEHQDSIATSNLWPRPSSSGQQCARFVAYENGAPPTAYFYPQQALAPWQHAFSPPREMDTGQQRDENPDVQHHHHHHHVHHHHHGNNATKKHANDNMCVTMDDQMPVSGIASGSGSINGSRNNSGSSPSIPLSVHVEPNKVAIREAALEKFRQKRKDRCFEKKVRYQSRKNLAEKRPRVKGQFVSQAFYNSNHFESR